MQLRTHSAPSIPHRQHGPAIQKVQTLPRRFPRPAPGPEGLQRIRGHRTRRPLHQGRRLGRQGGSLLRFHDLPGHHPVLLRLPAPQPGRRTEPLHLQPNGRQPARRQDHQRHREWQMPHEPRRMRGLPQPPAGGSGVGPFHAVPETVDLHAAGRQHHPAATVSQAASPVVSDTVRSGADVGPQWRWRRQVRFGSLLRPLQGSWQTRLRVDPGTVW
mmetsp:Transcript_4817/g.12633  ORF Transcript_4817/g.12633 Transcript_4817/m.12633 type:complete len:215 (+) Transcript_4817:1-645(+)